MLMAAPCESVPSALSQECFELHVVLQSATHQDDLFRHPVAWIVFSRLEKDAMLTCISCPRTKSNITGRRSA